MSNVNKVILVGNIGQDVELRFTANGQAVCNLRLATNRFFTDKEGKKQQRTKWHKVVVWGKQAENCAKYLAKGRQVFIEGRLEDDNPYTAKDGTIYRGVVVQANNVTFLGSVNQQSSQKVEQQAEESPVVEPEVDPETQEKQRLLDMADGSF